jgi:hypothetical protein
MDWELTKQALSGLWMILKHVRIVRQEIEPRSMGKYNLI